MNGMVNDEMTGTFLYFGYACALNQTLVEFRLNQQVEMLCKGKLNDFSLRFNRKNPDGTARGNLFLCDNDYTLGVVYKINKSKFEQLSQTEPEYVLTPFDILTENGMLSAYAFICHNCNDGIIPEKKYINNILGHARSHGFPEEYLKKISSSAAVIGKAT